MDAEVQQILEKTANYVTRTQTLLDNGAEMRETFLKRAHQVAGVLANRGIIAHETVNAFVDKMAEDETGSEVWNLVEKLASCIPVDDEMGKAAELMGADPEQYDAFERMAVYGDSRATQREPGMVD